MNTLSDAVKLYNQKLSDAGIGITVKINDQKTGLTLVDTTGSATHNMVFKDQTKSILVPGVDPIDAVDAVSGKIAGVDAVSFGMSAYSRLNFGKTGVLNGFTFQFTENPLDEGYVDDGTNKTFTFYIDRAAITAESDLEVRDQMVKDAIDNLIAAEWANIYPPATYGVIPPPEVSIDGYTAGDFAADALDDAFWGYNSSIWISSYSTLGQAEGTAVLTFETTWMNQFTFGFTTDQSLSGYISSSQKFNFYIDQDILDETDPATRDDMVKAAIDAQIATIWANDMPAVFREVDPPEVTLVAGLGDQAVYDAIFGGETAIKSSAAGAVMGQPAYAGIPDETIQHTAKIASAFGLNVDAASSSVAGSSLNKQCVSYNTLLSDLNGGAGVNMIGGKFEITDSRGGKYTITVDTKTMKTVGDFCDSINRISGLYVKAKINDSGDGIVLEEYGGGTQSFSCYDADSSSKFLSSLGLSGSVSQSKKDDDGRLRLSMSETHHIEVEAKDSLEDIRKKINDLNVGYSASILVDGSSTPYRLSISGKQTGAAGSFNVDLSAIGLSTEVMSEAKDAMIAYGDASKSNALTLTSKTNSFKGIINGMDLTITGVSDTPVTITSASSSSDVKVRLESFVNNYNNFRQYLNDMMRYSVSETKGVMVAEDGGYLWNSSVAKSFDRDVTDLLLKRVTGIPGIYSLADLGISVRRNFDDVSESIGVNSSTNSLIFDADKFQEAWDRDPEAVQKFFYDEREYVDKKGEKYTEKLGWAQKFEDLTDSLCGRADVLGKVQSRVDALTSTIDKNEARIAFLEERLKWKEQNYLKQFYAMEQAMARMTKDSSAIASIASNWQANSSSGG
jgi:flagellar hook-associated protein 2